MLSSAGFSKVARRGLYVVGAIAGMTAFFAILIGLPFIGAFETLRKSGRWSGNKHG
jgi:hypothetical protein